MLHFNATTVEKLQAKWGNGRDSLTYRGHDLMDLYINSDRIERAALGMEEETTQSAGRNPQFWDDVSVSCEAREYTQQTSGQEVMLLYTADTDVFVNGWDVFYNEDDDDDDSGESGHADVYFKINDAGEIIIVDVVRGNGLVYSKTGSYRQHGRVKSIIEIRLD